jgi:hypothetical protein
MKKTYLRFWLCSTKTPSPPLPKKKYKNYEKDK